MTRRGRWTKCDPARITEMSAKPLTYRIHLVPHGYQLDIMYGRKKVAGVCRDFAGSYDLKSLELATTQAIQTAMLELERTHLRPEDARRSAP